MITIKPTEHLVGINVQGDYYDFEGFVDAVHRLTGIWHIKSLDKTLPPSSYGDRVFCQ